MTGTIIIASNNPGKLKELKRLIEPLGYSLTTPAELKINDIPEETGATFRENAWIKAESCYRLTGLTAIADDSGLEVDALDGAPGVRSARFAGEGATDLDNNQRLLEKLRGVPMPERTAHFRCVAVCLTADGVRLFAEGSAEGVILEAPRGPRGFGYDPLFLDPVSGKTFAELDGAEKDAVSHRGKAFRSLAEQIKVLAGKF